MNSVNKTVTNPDPIAESKYTWPGRSGTSELTSSMDSVYYEINTFVYASGFVGALSITDITYGQSCGTTILTKFSGNVSYRGQAGHQYRATLTGAAFDGFEPVAKVPDGASIIWTNPI